MPTDSANSSKPWSSLTVRGSTKDTVTELRREYRGEHKEDITEDEVIAALVIGKSVKDLPPPPIPRIPGN